MPLIHAPAFAPAVYPYGLAQLRADNPNVSFALNPTAEDLAPFNVFPVEPTDPPACDARTERPEEGIPVQGDDGTWQQQWRIRPATPEEEAAYDAMNRPAPDWLTFKAAVLRSVTVNTALAKAYQVAPVAAAALAPSLAMAERGQPDEFAVVWGAIVQATAVPPAELVGLAALAEACNLPEAFVEAINPPAGMVRARDAAGRFIPDDPATPEDEAWVAAE